MNSVVWFRRDLRLDDHPALIAGIAEHESCLPLYIFDPKEPLGAASKWWLHHSLISLNEGLKKRGGQLTILQGDPLTIVSALVKAHTIDSVYWSRRYTPYGIELDTHIKRALEDEGVCVHSHNGSLLVEPWQVQKNGGGPYQVYTPFWRNVKNASISSPQPAPGSIRLPKKLPNSLAVEELNLLPALSWDSEFHSAWKPGEKGAQQRLEFFTNELLSSYKDLRNIPGIDGTSRLSPHLYFGEISPRRIWDKCITQQRAYKSLEEKENCETYMKELVWREFGYHLLFHFPETVTKPLREQFARFPWRQSKKDLQAWQKGMTGYPIVDAGMRQLWRTGWMHNRVRMIVGSFLVKHLLLPWQEGEKWFFDILVDADKASNTLGWQWIAGCGADAAPYFRIFNPILQGEKFDVQGEYIKQWVPELSGLPAKWIHKPWECPQEVLSRAKVSLGKTYPRPLVDHKEGRTRALQAYEKIKKS